MPKLVFKEATLNGSAEIVQYDDREYLNLRIKVDGKKSYRHASFGTTDLAKARSMAMEVYQKLISEPGGSKGRKFTFVKACEQFLQEKIEDDNIRKGSSDTYQQRIEQRIIPYASIIGLKAVQDIRRETFASYRKYYQNVKVKGRWNTPCNGLEANTINNDLSTLEELLKWFVAMRYMSADDLMIFDKKTKASTRNRNKVFDSNPPFMPGDWKIFQQHLSEKPYDNPYGTEYRWNEKFYRNWINFMYHCGARSHEVRKLRMRMIEFDDEGVLKKGILHIPHDKKTQELTKTGSRIVVMNGWILHKVKHHLEAGIEIANNLIEEHNKLVNSGEIKNFRWRNQEKIPYVPMYNDDTLLMASPFNKGMTMLSQESIRQYYKKMWQECKFKSKSNYTLHSLRKTYVTHALLNPSMSIRDIADTIGDHETTVQETYRGIDVLSRKKDIGFHAEDAQLSEELWNFFSA